MSKRSMKQLKTEYTFLSRIVSDIPETDIINRRSYENRLKVVEKELRLIEAGYREPASTTITFKGKPVVDSTGIIADFGSRALTHFSKAVAAIAANIDGVRLGDRGVIPNYNDYQVLITGTALGSFGFEIEENLSQTEIASHEADTNVMELAMEKAKNIIEASLGSDDDLSEMLFELDDRTISEFHEFLKVMADNEAYCALEVDDEYFTFVNKEQVVRSAKRIAVDNLTEGDEVHRGQFIGVLPESRTFEFKTATSETIIKGKVGKQIIDAMDLNHILETDVRITVHYMKVGTGNPRITLLDYRVEH